MHGSGLRYMMVVISSGPGVTTHEVPEASFVEENLDSWLDEVGQYCPWSAQLLSVEDYR